jgi:hypothetical protein
VAIKFVSHTQIIDTITDKVLYDTENSTVVDQFSIPFSFIDEIEKRQKAEAAKLAEKASASKVNEKINGVTAGKIQIDTTVLKDMRAKGMTIREISKETKLPFKIVSLALQAEKEHNLGTFIYDPLRFAGDTKVLDQIRALAILGLDRTEIAKELDCSVFKIGYHLKKHKKTLLQLCQDAFDSGELKLYMAEQGE